MATPDQIRALLAVPCDWCRADIGEACFTPIRRQHGRVIRLPVTTLDGESHQARWHRSLGVDAAVLSAVVAERQSSGASDEDDDTPVQPALVDAVFRPW